jgi:biotin synthase
MDLLYRAQTVHRAHFEPSTIQCSKLLSIKTGGCPEDCSYCSQSARYDSELSASKMMEVQKVLDEARKAKAAGATRYCMGAAWRSPKARDMPGVLAMVRGVKEMGLETCMTLGMLTDDQAAQLREAGLDYYNHNIDTSERYYAEVITSRTFADRLDTLDRVRAAGINVCSGGIVGMGETADDRIDMLRTLASMEEPPESVPINMLMPMKGTPMAVMAPLDPIEMVRTIATARILMPRAYVRLSAGRSEMSDELQALCFFAGANSIFVGDTLLTADNPGEDKDALLFNKLNLRAEVAEATPCTKPAEARAQEQAA